jgi:hypothetical protein
VKDALVLIGVVLGSPVPKKDSLTSGSVLSLFLYLVFRFAQEENAFSQRLVKNGNNVVVVFPASRGYSFTTLSKS